MDGAGPEIVRQATGDGQAAFVTRFIEDAIACLLETNNHSA
jgi:hypothetical protein